MITQRFNEPCPGWLAACKAGDVAKEPWSSETLAEAISEAPEFEFNDDRGEWLDELVAQLVSLHGESWEEAIREDVYMIADFRWDDE